MPIRVFARRGAEIQNMKTPARLLPLVQEGQIDEVLGQLMSGKEADIYVVDCGGVMRCAKVYKESKNRSFRQRSDYQEGRAVGNSRRARAMAKGSKFGKRELEEAWHSAEVDALYRLTAAGVRVPQPLFYDHGVLVMELVADAQGDVAPRLTDLELTEEQAVQMYSVLLKEVVRMLCAGLIHGDLSEYNVLVGKDGPVIIDLPQVVTAAGNNNARKLLLRDIDALALCLGRSAPSIRQFDYGNEIWQAYEKGTLDPDMKLTGRFKRPDHKADVGSVLRDIEDARQDALRRAGKT